MAVIPNLMLISHHFWWVDPCCCVPPKDMKVKKLPRKKVSFDNAVNPAPCIRTHSNPSGFPTQPGDYVSTVMSVKTYKVINMRGIYYDLTGANGFRCRIYREVYLTGPHDAAFRHYLGANGIKGSYWHDYLGCQEMVSFDYSAPRGYDIRDAKRCGKPMPLVGPIIEVDRKFIYVPKGGGRNAKSR